jgi:HlyD family secretion protein
MAVVSHLLRRPGVWILLAVLIGAAVAVAWQARGAPVSTAVASRMDLEQHLIASGRVYVVTRVELTAQASGRVAAVPAVEGQRVAAGGLLVQFDDAEAKAEVAQARAAAAQAEARVEQIRQVGAIVAGESSREAEVSLAQAESELARLEALAASGVIARADVDDARRRVEAARARLGAAAAERAGSAPSGADSRIAQAALAESRARLEAALVRLEQTRVVARHGGVVLARAVAPGDIVQAGAALMEMAADGDTQLVIEPDERSLAWIQVGQPALASADAFPERTFAAEVSYISPAVDPRRGSVEVRLRVPEPPPCLRPDMTISVDLTVATKAGALTVPDDAVRDAATANPWGPSTGHARDSRRRPPRDSGWCVRGRDRRDRRGAGAG